ncbi:MAG: hypothetical protein WD512_04630 [Candidatus Paceibacterota bacterium]
MSRRHSKYLRKNKRHTKKRGGEQQQMKIFQMQERDPAYSNDSIELPFVEDLDMSFMADDSVLYDENEDYGDYGDLDLDLGSSIGEEHFMPHEGSNLDDSQSSIRINPFNDELSSIDDENDDDEPVDTFVGGKKKNKRTKKNNKKLTRKNKRQRRQRNKKSRKTVGRKY